MPTLQEALLEMKKKRPELSMYMNTGKATAPLTAATTSTSYDPQREDRLAGLYEDFLARAGKTKYRESARVFGGLAGVVSEDLGRMRTERINAAGNLATAEISRAGVGIEESKGILEDEARRAKLGLEEQEQDVTSQSEYRSGQLAEEKSWHSGQLANEAERIRIASLGQESLEKSREDTATHQLGLLKVQQETKPTSPESMLSKLELQMQEDMAKVVQKTGAPESSTWFGLGGPNSAKKRIEAIKAQYQPEIDRYKKLLGLPTSESADVTPTFEDLQKRVPGLTKERYEAFLKSDAYKKRFGGK